MERKALLEALVSLADEAGVRVRRLAPGGGGPDAAGLPARSGACRIRGAPWLVLVASDPLEDRIAAAADALATLGESWREGRFLPPAVREAVEAAARRADGGHGSRPEDS